MTAANEVLAALRERWSSQWEVWHICWRSVLAHPTRKLETGGYAEGMDPPCRTSNVEPAD